jgi:hypothetical protein
MEKGDCIMSVDIIFGGLAALFAYLSWVRMTNKDISRIQSEMDTRISNYQTPPELNPVVYPTGAIVKEEDHPIYRTLRSLIPFFSPHGVTRIEVNVVEPEEMNIYRMRKDAFGPSSTYMGVRASNYDKPEEVVLNFNSIDPQKVQNDFFHALGLLKGDYRIELKDDTDLKSIWDPMEQAP